MNVVSRGDSFVEIQGAGENGVFDRRQLDALLDAAGEGLARIRSAQNRALTEG